MRDNCRGRLIFLPHIPSHHLTSPQGPTLKHGNFSLPGLARKKKTITNCSLETLIHYLSKSRDFLPSSVSFNWLQFNTKATDTCKHQHALSISPHCFVPCPAKGLKLTRGHLKPEHVSNIDKAQSCWPMSSWPEPRAITSKWCDCHLSFIPKIPPRMNVACRNTKHQEGQMFPNVV